VYHQPAAIGMFSSPNLVDSPPSSFVGANLPLSSVSESGADERAASQEMRLQLPFLLGTGDDSSPDSVALPSERRAVENSGILCESTNVSAHGCRSGMPDSAGSDCRPSAAASTVDDSPSASGSDASLNCLASVVPDAPALASEALLPPLLRTPPPYSAVPLSLESSRSSVPSRTSAQALSQRIMSPTATLSPRSKLPTGLSSPTSFSFAPQPVGLQSPRLKQAASDALSYSPDVDRSAFTRLSRGRSLLTRWDRLSRSQARLNADAGKPSLIGSPMLFLASPPERAAGARLPSTRHSLGAVVGSLSPSGGDVTPPRPDRRRPLRSRCLAVRETSLLRLPRSSLNEARCLFAATGALDS
jgi:hypothetical protein